MKFLKKHAIKFNSFQRKSINSLNYASMRTVCCLSFIGYQQDIIIILITMTPKNNNKYRQKPKYNRKVREDSFEAI